MDDIVNRASSSDSGKKFATGEAINSSLRTVLQPVYGIAQCTPDLSNLDCNGCLQKGISLFPEATIGVRVVFPSCNIQYEDFQFYDASVGGAPPPPSPLLPPPSKTTTNRPEYVMHGQFSDKSDVFSFGVLVLEIISGKKNSKFYQSDGAADLLNYAWMLWREGMALDLMDPTLESSHSRNEVTRCIHIALLCVQDDRDARPSMATVVLMLNSPSADLSHPQQPGFCGRTTRTVSNTVQDLESDQSVSKSVPWSVNEASSTELEAR
ncbi:hypothetical protein RHSIM_Rhsim13G0159700 [Rhododendron simsii]|uniref:Gnk2-homologous domain-containing protein n=1 Tax=Rhododendron simsii TaxID=118357 RepID=A0A834G3P7_RHOSS|nr:hypothetical protein RHSIM_Rhsim13G0159700 [Rhododendron simsii]